MNKGAPYAPFMDARTVRPPGLAPLDMAHWLACDLDYADQMAQRDAMIAAAASDVIAQIDGVDDVLVEFGEVLLAHLGGRAGWAVSPEAVVRPDRVEVALHGCVLNVAGRLAQEDFLLLRDLQGAYRLVAGVLCFPSRWSLSEKMGRALDIIHRPVPHYADHLAPRVNRVFAALAPERPVMRVNWLVTGTPVLRQVAREGEARPPADPQAGFWLRTERQTLVRLPRTRAIVFGVKTSLTAFPALTDAQRSGLHAALGQWSDAEVAYRGGRGFHEMARAALA